MRITSNSYMKVWEVRENENRPNFVDVRFTTSEKDKDGKWNQDFGSWASLWKGSDGNNAVPAAGDTIKPGASGRITNRYDKEKKQTYQNIIFFEYEVQANEKPAETAAPAAADDFMELPFDENEFV